MCMGRQPQRVRQALFREAELNHDKRLNRRMTHVRISKVLMVVSGILLVCSTYSFAQSFIFKQGSEPDGFRDMKWGTPLSNFTGMQYLRKDKDYEEVDFYLRKGEELKTERAKLSSIEYGFWKGRFYCVQISTKGLRNFEGLKGAVLEEFGQGYKSKRLEQYLWRGTQTMMFLSYDGISNGLLYMFSLRLDQQVEAEDRQKAKRGF